jgi:hypothetical protein
VQSRNGNPFRGFADLTTWIAEHVPVESAVLDGEIACIDEAWADQTSLLLLLIWRRVLHIDRRRKVREWVVAKYEPFNPILMFTK